VNIFIERNYLQEGRFIKVAEIIAMSLFIFARGASYREVEDRFQHCPATVGIYHHQVLEAFVKLSADVIRPFQSQHTVHNNIVCSPRFYWPFFKVHVIWCRELKGANVVRLISLLALMSSFLFQDCIGALDGTHIDCVVADEQGQRFRNRKGRKSWNILCVVNFDMMFTYVNVGWEGSTHDLPVLKDSLTQRKYDFPHPEPGMLGSYGGFAAHCLISLCNADYHLFSINTQGNIILLIVRIQTA